MINPATFAQILTNIETNLPGLWRFVTAGTFLAGIWFALRAVYLLKAYGELRMMMSVQTDLRGPLVALFVAVILLYWPDAVHVMLKSTFGTASITQYAPVPGKDDNYNQILRAGGHIIQFIGFIAFIRGVMLLYRLATQSGSQPGVLGKALAHIFGGIFAVNVFATWSILESLFTASGS